MCKAGYPKNGPDLWVSGRKIIKSILKILENEKSEDTKPSEIKFLRAMCLRNFHFPKF